MIASAIIEYGKMTQMDQKREKHDVCPPRLAWTLDNAIRKWFQNPTKILKPYILEGMRVADIGCGPGFFTAAMAELVGPKGKVVAVDLQQEMLEKCLSKLGNLGLKSRVEACLASASGFDVGESCNFVLAFYMVHEVPDKDALFRNLAKSLVSGGKLLVVEPNGHVSKGGFEESLGQAREAGLQLLEQPRMFMNRTALLEKG